MKIKNNNFEQSKVRMMHTLCKEKVAEFFRLREHRWAGEIRRGHFDSLFAGERDAIASEVAATTIVEIYR